MYDGVYDEVYDSLGFIGYLIEADDSESDGDSSVSSRRQEANHVMDVDDEGSAGGESKNLRPMDVEGGSANGDSKLPRRKKGKKQKRKEKSGVPSSVAFESAKSEARPWCSKEWALEKEVEWVGENNVDVGAKPPLRFIDVSSWPAEEPAVELPLTNPETALTTMLEDEGLIGTVCCSLPDVYTQCIVVEKAASGYVLVQGYHAEVGAFGSVERVPASSLTPER